MTTFLNDTDLSAYGLSSGAIAGELVFAAAMALDGETMLRQAEAVTIEDETRICLQQLSDLLGKAGCGLEDIVKVNCYLSQDAFRTEFWQTYDAVFADVETATVRLTQVVGIACECRVELDAVAVRRAPVAGL